MERNKNLGRMHHDGLTLFGGLNKTQGEKFKQFAGQIL